MSKQKEEGERGELLFDMICLPFCLGIVPPLLDCVILSAYRTANKKYISDMSHIKFMIYAR